MDLDDVQFLNILKGKRIKLTLKTSTYLGVVQRISPNKTLVLADVVSGSNGCKIPGSKMFFGHDILNVEFINEAKTDSGAHDEEHLNVEKFQPYRKAITLDDDKDEEEYINFVVIDEFHEKFGSAFLQYSMVHCPAGGATDIGEYCCDDEVMHIKKQRVIGVGADGIEVYKHGRLCWLQIATKNKVYLFDVLLLGAQAFKNGLSMILESKHILKVIHDCRAIAGCLTAQFGVKLTNVFDTQVADVMCFYSETGGLLPDRVSTLQEVVSLHLKVPSSQLLTLQMKSQLTKEERQIWQKRPCPVPLLKVMALSVIHLQPLRLVLLDTLMTDYVALVDSYLNSSHYEPGELEHVSMESVLELPKELRGLEQMRHERQEWAADHYPVTESGLLDRFNPRNQPPSQTSPAAEEQSQTQQESFEPDTEESPSSTQVDPLLHKPPVSPPRVTTVSSADAHASPDPAAQVSVQSVTSPLSVGVGRGCTQVLMDTMGRGRPSGKEQSSIPASPAGRGFLLQMLHNQLSKEITAEMKTPGLTGMAPSFPNHTLTQEVMPQPAGPSDNDLPLTPDTFGKTGDHEFPSSSLMQSFRSFRY